MDSPDPQIIITRPSGRYRDGSRRYRIEVDGKAAGEIGPGEELIVPVGPGLHDVQARIDWTGSPKVEVKVADDYSPRLTVRPAGSAAYALLQVLSRTRYLVLEPA